MTHTQQFHKSHLCPVAHGILLLLLGGLFIIVMTLHLRKITSIVLALFLASIGFAFAQEGTASVDATMAVEPVQVGTLPPRPDSLPPEAKVKDSMKGSYDLKPMKGARTPEMRAQVRSEIKDTRTEFRDSAQEKREEFRTELKDDMKNAATGTRRDVMRGAIEDRKELQKEIKDDRMQMRSEIKERKAALKDRIKDALKTRLGSAITRLNNAVQQFDSLSARIQSRIDKLKASGATTTTAESALSSAASLIVVAKADITALQSLVNSASSSADDAATETIKAQIKTAMEKATASVKAAHEGLRAAVQTLSGIKVNATASTTITN